MGAVSTNGQCLISKYPARDLNLNNSNWSGYEYEINVNGIERTLFLEKDANKWQDTELFKVKRHIIAGLLLNNKWFEDDHLFIKSVDDFKELLNSHTYPTTPKDLRDFLFLNLVKKQETAGQTININNGPSVAYSYYLKDWKELNFYLRSLEEEGLIQIGVSSGAGANVACTYSGLNYAIELESEGVNSKKCFIAMSFGDEMAEIRAAIKTACDQTGYDPIIVDEIEIDSHNTINDAIISNLKKCKFTIADFTEQKDGVYFESGYALGQGKKVIYTCREDWFNGTSGVSHFDTNHFPHIIYKDTNDLQKKLINKIGAWID